MTLANISQTPTDLTQGAFDFSHQQDHNAIIAAIYASKGVDLPIRAIFPSVSQGASWKQLHQAMHSEMNGILGINGQNLQGEIDDGWYSQNYEEHQAAHQILGI